MTRTSTIFDPVADVEDFHRKFSINYQGPPRALPHELGDFRLKFLEEELTEYEEAVIELGFALHTNAHRDEITRQLAQALDSLVDLVYVVLGTAHLHGFDFRTAWSRVHAANMLKDYNPDERYKLKITKPPGWLPPDHTNLVNKHEHGAPDES